MQRAVVSYDDITLPYSPEPPRASSSNASQSKKRKWSNHNQKSDQQQAQNKNTKPPPVEEPVEDDDAEDADSRYLTSEEIWDDSALIDAWNAATEEYEAFNGPEKGWKNEPVHKSPLWYNVPPNKPPKKKLKTEPMEDAGGDAVGDSQPLDFDTFVPTYDASLALPVPEVPDYGQDYSALPPPGVGVASQDEAFSRALGAMYWGGYWTAVYHCHRSAQQVGTVGESGEDQDNSGEGEDGADVEDEEDFVPTQR
ncbi:hypothetical protein C8R43DRAFT_874906 [Mycena crocata]|nr:hypothetical protein C8R43DRAFT_874906 [Mycena crocata]